MFTSNLEIAEDSWQAFERNISRLLMCEGYDNVRVVGQSGDHGADVTASLKGKRWLFQAKKWAKPVGVAVVDETVKAAEFYEADIPVIVSSSGFESPVFGRQLKLMRAGTPLQLWDSNSLVKRASRLSDECPNKRKPHEYQDRAIEEVVASYLDPQANKALVVMATGLGKTFVAAESIRRIRANRPGERVLVCAHTNELVYQLEKAFWPFLKPSETTVIWNGYEKPSERQRGSADFVFACVDSIVSFLDSGGALPEFDILLVDECHHVGSPTYNKVFDELQAGTQYGSFALGLTATPWRADEVSIEKYFGKPRVNIDTVQGLKKGFLANVDYRMYTSNVNWDALKSLDGETFSPKQINKTLFIDEWDDAVVETLQKTWREQPDPKAIVFCGTIDHAVTMRNKINELHFARAEALFSGSSKNGARAMNQFERNRVLSNFADGRISVICVVDIFNEGIDVPDVNILVFQRVTHSRRIFIQQLGRGLRISEGKDKVIVLDFVSDVRRFAAGIELKDGLASHTDGQTRISIKSKVSFMKAGGEDPQAETFLRQWLDDVVAIESLGEDDSALKYPPALEPSIE